MLLGVWWFWAPEALKGSWNGYVMLGNWFVCFLANTQGRDEHLSLTCKALSHATGVDRNGSLTAYERGLPQLLNVKQWIGMQGNFS